MGKGFSYGDYFQAVRVLERLMGGGDDRAWLLRHPENPRPAKTVWYIGCNMLRTTHLTRTVTQIMDYFDEDYVAVGGPAYCCGIVHRFMDDHDPAELMFKSSMDKFADFKPETVVLWCPSCEVQLDHMLEDYDSLPYKVIHTTELIARRLREVPDLQPVPLRVALHAHRGTPQYDRDTAFIQEILERIPGLEIVDWPEHPELTQHCSRFTIIPELGMERYFEVLDTAFRRARERDVDYIVSVYHGCHRELCKFGKMNPPVINYVQLVARALGLSLPEDRYQGFAADDDLESIAQILLPEAEAQGLSREKVMKVLQAEFGGASSARDLYRSAGSRSQKQ